MTLFAPVARRLIQRVTVKPMRARLQAPLASITFDDFPASAWTVGGEILARRNLKGTYYVSGSYSGRTLDGLTYFDARQLVDLAAAGHEVGCHSFSHIRGARLGDYELLSDVDRNASFVQDHLGDYRLSSFAYPFGDASLRTKSLFGRRFSCSRGISKGVNHGLVDLSQLKAIGLESAWWTPEYVEKAVRRVKRDNGWLIFFTHDVSEDPSPYGATPGMLNHALDLLQAAHIEVLPVKHALARTLFNGGLGGAPCR